MQKQESEALHPPAILPPREVDSSSEHKATEEYALHSFISSRFQPYQTGRLPHQSSAQWQVMGVPIIPRPADPTLLLADKKYVTSQHTWAELQPEAGSNRFFSRRDLEKSQDGCLVASSDLQMPLSRKSQVPQQHGLKPTTPRIQNFGDPITDDRRFLQRKLAAMDSQIMQNKKELYTFQHSLRVDDTEVSNDATTNDGTNASYPENVERVQQHSSAHWQEYWDHEVGASYYYNVTTGEASWVNPTEV